MILKSLHLSKSLNSFDIKLIITFILGAEAYFFLVQSGKGEDIAGGVVISFFMIFIAVIIATTATLFEKILQNCQPGDILEYVNDEERATPPNSRSKSSAAIKIKNTEKWIQHKII